MTNVQIVQELYAAFARRDDQAIRELLHPEVEWIQNEGFPGGGKYKGVEVILNDVFARFRLEWDTWQAPVHEWLDSGDAVIALGEYSGTHKQTGRLMTAAFAHVYRLRQGRIIRFQQYADTLKIAEAMQAQVNINSPATPRSGQADTAPRSPLASLENIRDFRLINPSLATSGQPAEAEFGLIRNAGYEVVINLAMPSSDWAIPHEGKIVSSLGMAYVHLPVDFQKPGNREFDAFSAVMQGLQDKRIFVHCAANKRVSAFLFLHRVLHQGIPIDVAKTDLHAVWNPDDVWEHFIQDQLNRHQA